jgi:hypothetical protein
VIVVPQPRKHGRTQQVRRKTFREYGHIWEYGADVVERIAAAGFEVEVKHVWDETTGGPRRRRGPFYLVYKLDQP